MWSEQQLFHEKKNSSQDGEVTRDRKKTRILGALNEDGRIHDIGRNSQEKEKGGVDVKEHD